MAFRPCIDLHDGRVKQVVGATVDAAQGPRTNFVSPHPPAYFAGMYRQDGLTGGHIISLGSGNREAAREALGAWPGGMQYGGGVHGGNAMDWLDAGASAVIVTSYLFDGPRFLKERLEDLSKTVGPSRLVVDLSCREKDGAFVVMSDRWKTWTDLVLTPERLKDISRYCGEFLIHAVDQEGLQSGLNGPLVDFLSEHTPIPCVYAGGIHTLDEVEHLDRMGRGLIHYTVGSALDVFGGRGLRYRDLVDRTRRGSGVA